MKFICLNPEITEIHDKETSIKFINSEFETENKQEIKLLQSLKYIKKGKNK